MNSSQTSDIIPTGPPSGCGSASGEAYNPPTEEQRMQGMLPTTISRSPSLCGSASGLIPRPVPEQTPAPVSSPGTIHTNTEARSTLSSPQPGTSALDDFPPAGENILPQLLGIDDAEEHATKSPLAPAREPHQNVAVADTPPAAAKNDFLAQCFDKLQAQLEQHNKNFLEEIDKNTRSVRFMEKAMREQVEALNSLLRINAREERRRRKTRGGEERRKEERRKTRGRKTERGSRKEKGRGTASKTGERGGKKKRKIPAQNLSQFLGNSTQKSQKENKDRQYMKTQEAKHKHISASF